MQKAPLKSIFSEWYNQIEEVLESSNSFHIAVFSSHKELLYSNTAIDALIKNDPIHAFINPTFDQLLATDHSKELIFEGFLTLGDYSSVNSSIQARVYRKKDKLLVIGNVNTDQIVEQNKIMHQLNREISDLQRNLIKKTHSLENTLTQLKESENQLIELNNTKDKLFSVIAHDLRSPFNSILGFSDLLIRNSKQYKATQNEEFLNIINSSAKHTLILLDNLLNWAKTQTGQVAFTPEQLELSSIIDEIMSLSTPSAKAKEIALTYRLPDGIKVFADLNMIKTVLRNLISNAIKFTHTSGKIHIEIIENSLSTTFKISDNGLGMSKETQSKIFNQATNASTNGTANEKGSGLGLILCKEFVEMHGGNIIVESQLDKGSTFKFTIPKK